tara:strand:- start:63 stop:383 length:321 start_codon:yes stop_codon:yes gene_type:complete
MNNRLNGLKPDGRVGRENQERYDRLAKAQIETLRYYFNEEWFDDHTIKKDQAKKRKDADHSRYSLNRCSECKQVWNYYLDRTKKIQTRYWDHFNNLPLKIKKCRHC